MLLLESGSRFGGCLHSHRTADGYWYELGAHTTYNSYGGFLDIAAGSGATAKIVQRGPARAQFGYLRGDAYEWLSPPALLRRFNWLEIVLSAPFAILRGKSGRTMGEYYGGLLGRGNYERFLRPFLAAVPSQDADGFPADGPGSLFKKRPRRKEFPRSYGFDGGLQTVCDAALRTPGLRVEAGAAVTRVAPSAAGFVVTTADGRTFAAPVAAVATPIDAAAAMLRDDFPELAQALAPVKTVTIDSLGVVLPRARCWMPEAAFVIRPGPLLLGGHARPLPRPAAPRLHLPLQGGAQPGGAAPAHGRGAALSRRRAGRTRDAPDPAPRAGSRARPRRRGPRPAARRAPARADGELLPGARDRGLRPALVRGIRRQVEGDHPRGLGVGGWRWRWRWRWRRRRQWGDLNGFQPRQRVISADAVDGVGRAGGNAEPPGEYPDASLVPLKTAQPSCPALVFETLTV